VAERCRETSEMTTHHSTDEQKMNGRSDQGDPTHIEEKELNKKGEFEYCITAVPSTIG